MSRRSPDLHGSAPDECRVVLLLIDVVNDLEFEGGEELLGYALPMARRLAALKARAGEAGIPALYVNDNFGRWRSDFNATVDHCLRDGVRGRPIVELLRPGPEDYFVLKPKNSGFYSTCLRILLDHFAAERLILTGLTGDNCVLFTANDAYLRDYRLSVPADCVASIHEANNTRALEEMRRILKADTRPSHELDLAAMMRRP